MNRKYIIILIAGIFLYPAAYTKDLYGQDRNIYLGNLQQDTLRISSLIREAALINRTIPDSAIKLCRAALAISYSIKDTYQIGRTMVNLGVYEMGRKAYSESINWYYKAMPYCLLTSSRNEKMIPVLYYNMGAVFTKHGSIDSALHYYYKFFDELGKRKIKDDFLLMSGYIGIGGTLAFNDQNEQALHYLHKAGILAVTLNDSLGLALSYINISLVFFNLQRQDSSRYYASKALMLYREMGSSRETWLPYYNIGSSWGQEGNFTIAKAYYDSAVLVNPACMKESSVPKGYGDIYLESGNFQAAIPFYKTAAAYCQEQEMRMELLGIYYSLARCYHETGKSDQAYGYLKMYLDLKDSLVNTEKITTINQLELKYRTAEMNKTLTAQKLLLAQKENNLQKQTFFIAGTITCSGLLIFMLSFRHRNRQRLQREKILSTARKHEVERLHDAMQAEERERNRIAREMHDGMGVLLSAAKMNYTLLGKKNQQLTHTETYLEGMGILNEMRDELRAIAHNLMPETIAQHNLTDALRILADRIQKISPVAINVQVYGPDPVLRPEFNFTVYRMAEELMHNAVKHAAARNILIQLLYDEQCLHLTVEDDGSGFDPEKKYPGMGLQNLYSRTANLHGVVSIQSSAEKGTAVTLEIPYKCDPEL